MCINSEFALGKVAGWRANSEARANTVPVISIQHASRVNPQPALGVVPQPGRSRFNITHLETVMNNVNRRDVVKLAAGLAVGAGVLAAQPSPAQEAPAASDPSGKPSVDRQLEMALKDPERFQFTEQFTFKTSTTDPHTQHLEITPVQGSRLGYDVVAVPTGTIRIFRADAAPDEFTKKGGLYWKCGKDQGKLQFKQPGPLVMVVRDKDGTVHCYSLAMDYRC
jgi:hypothetical protein